MVRSAPFVAGALTSVALLAASACSASTATSSSSAGSSVATSSVSSESSVPSLSSVARGPSVQVRASQPSRRSRPGHLRPSVPARGPTAARTGAPRAARPRPLPLAYPTGDARQAVTVIAAGESSTVATLQRWERGAAGWRRVGPTVPAEVGADGLARQASEMRSATPEGSFTLTRAFGRDADPGTALPYRQTTPADWWISEAGPLYNTLQRCSSGCPFTQGDPNEHLYYSTPFYDYAVVIDYNTANSPTGVRPGAGSAFFLHVSVGRPTAGCIAVDRAALLDVLRWLRPDDHPRIVIGVG